MSRRESHASQAAPEQSGYHDWVREADKALARKGIQLRPDNWQQLALDWSPSNKAEREVLARYIAKYEEKLGVTWARDLLRLMVFLRADDSIALITHYKRAMRAYPRCPLVEMWAGFSFLHDAGEIWLAREMQLYAASEMPDFAEPFYHLGVIHHLVGDLAGALEYFEQAAARATGEDRELAARVFYNRGATRFLLTADTQAAIADLEQALRYKPDYAQAKSVLRALKLKLKLRWML